MSTTIDNRVVEMQFDNKHFEKNVATSLGTLDKLKNSLKLDSISNSLKGLSGAAKKVDMTPVGKAAETVGLKFNAMFTMADQALRNITNSAMNAGKRIVSALTLDPVKTGFQEYETKIGSIQTIMSNTASKGTTMSDVTRVIDELNTYADKTIYNFAEMTRNIGTFTAAGVGLEESAAAIQGIANLAASSGSTSQQASTAMYQLSQALAAGTVKLMDWNSVVNAGMGGEKFQEALKATARDHGIHVDELIKKNGSFRESLSEGWISADILNETLNKFTVDGAKNYAKSMQDSGKWTKEQADALIKEAQAMEDAATKVKTFTQLWDTMKESAQSGWGKTWELIVGDFEEAKTLWTNVSTVVGGMIDKSANYRNDMLEGALSSPWEKLTKEINGAGIETKDFEESVKKIAKEHGYDTEKLIENYGSLEKVFQSGALSSSILNEALGKTSHSMTDLSKVTKTLTTEMTGDDVKQVEEALKSLGYTLTGKDGKDYSGDGYFGTLTRDAVKAFQKTKGLKVTGIVDKETLQALKDATTQTQTFKGDVDDLIKSITELGGREKLIQSFRNVFLGLSRIANPVSKSFRQVFPRTTSKQLVGLIDGFQSLTEKFEHFTRSVEGQKVIDNLASTFKGIFSVADLGVTIFAQLGKGIVKIATGILGFGGGFLEVTGSIGRGLTALHDWIEKTGLVPAAMELLTSSIQNGIVKVKDFVSSIKNYMGDLIKEHGGIEQIITNVFGEPFATGIKKLGEFFGKLKEIESFNSESLSALFSDFKTNVLDYFKTLDPKAIFDNFISGLKNFAGKVSDYAAKAGEKFGGIIEKITNFGKAVKSFLGKNLGGLLALGGLLGLLGLLKLIKEAIEKLVHPLEFLDDLGEVFKRLGKSLTLGVKANALKAIAISIGILAASLAVLAMVPYGKLWSAVGAMFAVSAMLAGIIIVLSKFGGNVVELAKMSSGVMMLAGSLLVFAIAAKIIAGIDDGDIGKCVILIGGFIGIVALISKAASKVDARSIASFGSMMMGLSGALLIMAIAINILGRMDTGVLLKGGAAVVVFMGMMVGMMAATNLLAKYIPKFAGAMAGLSAALLILTVSVGILGNMDLGTLLKGGIAVAAFMAMMAGMMKATNLLNGGMPKFGAAMLGLAAGVLALAIAAKIIAGIDGEDLLKGGFVISAFLAMMAGMMKATQLLTKNSANAAKVGAMMLSFAGAMVLLTGVIYVLSKISPADLTKATLTIAGIGVVFAGLMAVSKFAKVGKGASRTMIAMAAAVGIIAASLVALSIVDTEKLKGATEALTLVVGAFAVLTAATKFIGAKTLGTLLVLVGAVAILGALLKMLSDIPGGNALSVAAALSALLISLSASCLILAAVGGAAIPALAGIGVLAVLMGVIAAFAAITIGALPDIGTKLSQFMANLTPFLEGIKSIDTASADNLKTLGEAIALFTASGFLNSLTLGVPLKSLSGQLVGLGRGLASFSNSLSGSNFDSEKIKDAAAAAQAIAGVSINLASGQNLIDWLSGQGDLSKFGSTLKGFGEGLSEFNKSVGTEDFATDKIIAAADAAQALAGVSIDLAQGTTIIDWLSGQNDLSLFGGTLKEFGSGLSEFNKAVSDDTFDVEKIKSAAAAAQALAGVSISLAEGTGFMDWVTGQSDLSTFGDKVASFGDSLVAFNKAVGSETFDTKKIESAADAAQALAGVSISIAEGTGFIDWITGQSDLSKFGSSLTAFGEGLVSFNKSIVDGNIDTAKITSAAEAAQALAGVSITLAEGTGFVDWITAGQSNLAKFGNRAAKFGEGLVAFNKSVVDGNIDVDKITSAAEAAQALAGVTVTLAEGTGFMDWILGQGDLSTFGGTLTQFGTGIAGFNDAISKTTFDDTKLTAALDAANSIAGIGLTVGDNSTFWDWLTGRDSLDDFATNLETFGISLASFATSVSGESFDMAAVTAAITEISKLAGIAATVGGDNAGSLDSFGLDISILGGDLNAFYANISEIDAGKLSAVASAISELASINTDNADALQSFINSLGEVGASGVDAFAKAISDGAVKVLPAASKLMLGAIKGVTTKKKLFDANFKGIVTKAVATVKSFYGEFVSAGGYLAMGFALGIIASTVIVVAAAAAMAKAAKLAAEAALGISSPAREMIKPGGYTAEGFAKGILGGIPTVYNAAKDTAEYAKKGFSDAVTKVSDLISSGIDDQPTIRPVLDLSDVSNGINRMGGMFGMNPEIGLVGNVAGISSMMNRRQNGTNSDVVSAIKDLGSRIGESGNNYYSVNGVSYSDGDVSDAIRTLVRAANVERRT